jgi:beta-N-acetylhexosaminidase
MSAAVLDGLLRGDLGFAGVVVSDALDMAGASATTGIPEAAALALAAGCDLLCLGPDNTDEQIVDIERAVQAAVDSGRLGADRLSVAAERVRALAERVRVVGEPPPVRRPAFSLDEVAAQFDVAASAKSAFDGGPADRWKLVCVESAPNIAAGVAPWGPQAALAAGDVVWTGDVAVVDRDTAADVVRESGGVVLVGRANHRHAWVRELADRRRAAGPTVVVDMGWPADDRAYADIATFGASRLLGAALVRLLAELAGDGGRAR